MFSRKEKPLPQPVFQAIPQSQINDNVRSSTEGIFLGEDCYWNPAALPNGHVVAIGASGSGKTQTLKAIAFSLRQTYPDIQIFVIDFHGDQEITGETCYPLHMASSSIRDSNLRIKYSHVTENSSFYFFEFYAYFPSCFIWCSIIGNSELV